MSYESTLAYIHSVQWRGQKPGLARTQALLEHLGHPERRLKFVHIGGTNGKGSTAALIESVLRQAGYRTGLYTSPYLNRFNERIRVDGQEIADIVLEQIVDEIRPFADRMEDLPSEFELITAIALEYFARRECDVVVLEVGLGGEFDATNVIPCPEVAVLTAIGLDHTAVLGPTVADIARTKAGIIKEGGDVVSYGHLPEADAEIEAACAARHATLWPVDFDQLALKELTLEGRTFDLGPFKNLTMPLLASYQPKNAAVAVTALSVLAHKGCSRIRSSCSCCPSWRIRTWTVCWRSSRRWRSGSLPSTPTIPGPCPPGSWRKSSGRWAVPPSAAPPFRRASPPPRGPRAMTAECVPLERSISPATYGGPLSIHYK